MKFSKLYRETILPFEIYSANHEKFGLIKSDHLSSSKTELELYDKIMTEEEKTKAAELLKKLESAISEKRAKSKYNPFSADAIEQVNILRPQIDDLISDFFQELRSYLEKSKSESQDKHSVKFATPSWISPFPYRGVETIFENPEKFE